MKQLLLVLSLTLIAGCARLHSVTYRNFPVILANGTVTNGIERTELTISTFWDATSELTKARNQSSQSGYGSNTFAPGTYVSNLSQSSTSTNINQLAEDIVAAAVSAAVKSAK